MGQIARPVDLSRASATGRAGPCAAVVSAATQWLPHLQLRRALPDTEARVAAREALEAREREIAARLVEVQQQGRELLVRMAKEASRREIDARRAERINAREQALGPRERAVRAREEELDRLQVERERFERERTLERDVQRRVAEALAAGRRDLAARERELEEREQLLRPANAPLKPLLLDLGRASTRPRRIR